MKTKNFQSSHEERHIPHFLTCETSHYFLKTSKMARRKVKISELQNMKTKKFQSSQEERQIPPFAPEKENEDPQNDKKKIENPQTLKKTKNPPKFTK
jgi:hypothetical protein